jgi:tryptophan-rich sensory protein
MLSDDESASPSPIAASRLTQGLGLVASIGICFAAAGIGSQFTEASVGTWYATLTKPSWTPPGWVFGPVWSLLYLAMGVSAWLVWRTREDVRGPLMLFALQLAVNASWSGLFFGLRSPGAAFAEILLLWLAILATLAVFWRRSLLAGLLLLPYLLWVSFAAALNFSIWRLNS